jgi:hypothetical protein
VEIEKIVVRVCDLKITTPLNEVYSIVVEFIKWLQHH